MQANINSPLCFSLIKHAYDSSNIQVNGIVSFATQQIASRVSFVALGILAALEFAGRFLLTLAKFTISVLTLGLAGKLAPSLQFSELFLQSVKTFKCFLGVLYGLLGVISPSAVYYFNEPSRVFPSENQTRKGSFTGLNSSPQPTSSHKKSHSTSSSETSPFSLALSSQNSSLVLGEINQYEGRGNNSSCTCNAIQFLKEAFALNSPSEEITSAFVTNVINNGKHLFDHVLLPTKESQFREIYDAMVLEDKKAAQEFYNEQVGAAMSAAEVLAQFENEFAPMPKAPDTHPLYSELEDREHYFNTTLNYLYNQFFVSNHSKSVGSVITCNGTTSCFAILRDPHNVPVYAVFDSHGQPNLNNSPKGFVFLSKDPKAAASYLAQMFDYIPIENFSSAEYDFVANDYMANTNQISLTILLSKN